MCVRISLYSKLAAGYGKVKGRGGRGGVRPSTSFKSENVSPRT
jgi:hypothetical protein